MQCKCEQQPQAAKASCEHVREFIASDAGQKALAALIKYRRMRGCLADFTEATQEAELGPPAPECFECGAVSAGLHACMHCVHLGCRENGHAASHAAAASHALAMELERGHVFCATCSDYSYDDGSWRRPREPAAPSAAARRRVPFAAREPTAAEAEIVRRGTRGEREDVTIGLRGLNNLGNTCFMNAILQSLVHNPLIRDFFLSDRHSRRFCPAAAAAPPNAEFEDPYHSSALRNPSRRCLACEFDRLVSETFSGERAPYSPSELLTSVWMHAQHLAGYEQQDAHEFLMAALDAIHEGTAPAVPPPPASGPLSVGCSCVVHGTLAGILRSDLTCTTCGHVSPSYDPFVDISLDLRRPGPARNGDPSAICESLSDCLRRYTRAERLSQHEAITCARCKDVRECTKRLSVRRLPAVLCFHLKRFEHSTGVVGGLGRQASSKIDAFIEYPLDALDMRPYLSPPLPEDEEDFDDGDEQAPMYDLFSVVVHTGTIDNGHYVCKIRHGGRWFAFDDATVSAVDAEDVRASRGYLLFYIQRRLQYERRQ